MGADLERTAIMRLQEAANMSERFYKAPLIVTTSGGKDSSVCIALAERAGIEFEVMHNHTTVDAPETVYFIRNELKRLEQKGVKCFLNYPYYKGERVTMWSLIPQKLMPPTRLVRYCCSILKEQGGQGRYIESCMRQRKAVCNPIIDWKDSDVWDYIESEKIPVNPLYKCGYSRVGCVGCPMAGKAGRNAEFARYPKYQEAYIRAFGRMLEERKRRGRTTKQSWETGRDVFHWWIEDGVLPGQIELDDLLSDEDYDE